jgi:micrococcal nuclease
MRNMRLLPSYPDVCIAPPPPNLNCDDVPYNDIKVEGDDPHGFDREGDGIGCES